MRSRIAGSAGCKRVVPIAVAIRRQRRAGDDTTLDDFQRALDMLPQRHRWHRLPSTRRTAPARRESSCRPTRSDTAPSASNGQNTMSPCESPARMSRSRSKNMNHCGQSPSERLRLHDSNQQIANRREMAQRQQHLDRPLRHIARAPAAAGVLLQAARRQVMHQRVVSEPRQDLGEPLDLRRQSGLPDGASMPSNSTSCSPVGLRHIDAFGDEVASHRESKRLARGRRRCKDTAAGARRPSAKQQFIATDAFRASILRCGVIAKLPAGKRRARSLPSAG